MALLAANIFLAPSVSYLCFSTLSTVTANLTTCSDCAGHLKLYLTVNTGRQQSTFRLLNYMLGLFFVDFSDGPQTHFPTAVTEILRAFIPPLDRVL
jgi:hypothetical protein